MKFFQKGLMLAAVSSLLFLSCKNDDCDVPDCRINLAGQQFEVLDEALSGGSGTQFTPDVLNNALLTRNTAQVQFTVKQIGACHKVVGYGHVWSPVNPTPIVGQDIWTDFGVNVNFNDVVISNLPFLSPNTTYWVRSWVAIEIQDCQANREIFYNDEVTVFTTLP